MKPRYARLDTRSPRPLCCGQAGTDGSLVSIGWSRFSTDIAPSPLDFAKWAAERVGWFNYLALRTLGLVSSPDTETDEALKGAIATLRETAAGLPQLERWAAWMA